MPAARRVVPLSIAAALLLSACGRSSHTYSLAKTSDCLRSAGVRLGGQLDFVASTSTGGAVRARLHDDAVTLVFGQTVADADAINDAYHRFRSLNVGIEDVLRQDGNAVMLWQHHPNDKDVETVVSCLK